MKETPVFLMVGSSAVGKSSLVQALIERKKMPLRRFITTTTREPRPGERNGVDYWFVSKEEFEKEMKAGLFFEYADVYGSFYGSNKRELERLTALGDPIIIIIDQQGAQTLKREIPQAKIIFLHAPKEQLIARLVARELDRKELEQRVAALDQEALFQDQADIVVSNADGKQVQAVEELEQKISESILALAPVSQTPHPAQE